MRKTTERLIAFELNSTRTDYAPLFAELARLGAEELSPGAWRVRAPASRANEEIACALFDAIEPSEDALAVTGGGHAPAAFGVVPPDDPPPAALRLWPGDDTAALLALERWFGSWVAERCAEAFTREVLSRLPPEGGVVRYDEALDWIRRQPTA
jgi:hypothetical protein